MSRLLSARMCVTFTCNSASDDSHQSMLGSRAASAAAVPICTRSCTWMRLDRSAWHPLTAVHPCELRGPRASKCAPPAQARRNGDTNHNNNGCNKTLVVCIFFLHFLLGYGTHEGIRMRALVLKCRSPIRPLGCVYDACVKRARAPNNTHERDAAGIGVGGVQRAPSSLNRPAHSNNSSSSRSSSCSSRPRSGCGA